MKVNSLRWTALLAAILLPFSVFGQQEPQFRMAPIPPPHVQKCMQDMQLYRQFFLFRGGGLSIEEARISNGFAMRITEFVSRESKIPLEPSLAERLDSMLVEVYDLSEADFNNPTFQRGWGSLKMSACMETNAPPQQFLPPADNQDRRMIPDISA